jgi:hypothetical protein
MGSGSSARCSASLQAGAGEWQRRRQISCGGGREGIALRKIAEVIGQSLNIPAVGKSSEDAAKLFSWLTSFVEADNPVSSQLTQERLQWRPTQPGIISDLAKSGL